MEVQLPSGRIICYAITMFPRILTKELLALEKQFTLNYSSLLKLPYF